MVNRYGDPEPAQNGFGICGNGDPSGGSGQGWTGHQAQTPARLSKLDLGACLCTRVDCQIKAPNPAPSQATGRKIENRNRSSKRSRAVAKRGQDPVY